jgi:hypothetical protein
MQSVTLEYAEQHFNFINKVLEDDLEIGIDDCNFTFELSDISDVKDIPARYSKHTYSNNEFYQYFLNGAHIRPHKGKLYIEYSLED